MEKKAAKLEFAEKYTYNTASDTYVIPMKHRAKPFVLKGYKLRAIRRAMSNAISPAQPAAEVALRFKILSDDLDELKKIFGLGRDVFPLTNEEVDENTIEKSIEVLREEKQAAITQLAEKQDWKQTLEEAEKWRAYQAGTLDPISTVLELWEPPKVDSIPLNKPSAKGKDESEEVFVIGLADLHFGSSANERYMYGRGSWGTKDTVNAVKDYADAAVQTMKTRTYKFKKVIILGMGDLIHSINGKTGRGTELVYDSVREEQFEYALTSLRSFIARIYQHVPVVEVHSVYGNHAYDTEMALFRALEMAFTNEKTIKFFHYASRPASFREGATLFVLDHGADSIERAYVPTGSDSKLQQHVQSLLLQRPELLIGAKTRLFCVGDKHHWENVEYNDFEFIMFGTIIAGDEHSARNNLCNRARQSCLILDSNGLKEIVHFYPTPNIIKA